MGSPRTAAVVTKAGQQRSSASCAFPSQADTVVSAKGPKFTINYLEGTMETPLSLCSSKHRDKVAQCQWHCSDLTAGTR